MSASATLALIGLLICHCLAFVSSNRVLKETTSHTESTVSSSKHGSSSAWATTMAGNGQASASASGYGSISGTGTALGVATGSESGGDSVGVGIGMAGTDGSGYGTGTGSGIGIGIGVGGGGDSGLGTGVGIGIGGATTGSGTVRNEPTCNHGRSCNPIKEEPPIEIPVWIPGECGECNHDRISGSSGTRKLTSNKGQSTPVTKKH